MHQPIEPDSPDDDYFDKGVYLDEESVIEVVDFDSDEEPGSSTDNETDNSPDNAILALNYRIVTQHETICCLDVYLSSTPSLLATGGTDETIHIWNFSNASHIKKLNSHKETVTSLHFHASKPLLLSADLSGLILVWDIQSPNYTISYKLETDSVQWVEWFDYKSLAVVCGMSGGGLQLWHCQTQQYRLLVGSAASEYHVPYIKFGSSGDTKVVYGSEDGSVVVWGLKELKTLSTLRYPKYGAVVALEFSLNDSLFFCSFAQSSVIVAISAVDSREICTLHDRSLGNCSSFFKLISRQHALVAVGQTDGSDGKYGGVLALWDASSRRLLTSLSFEVPIVDAVMCGADVLCVGFEDGHFELGNIHSLDVLKKVQHGPLPVEPLKFIPHSSLLIVVDYDAILSVYALKLPA